MINLKILKLPQVVSFQEGPGVRKSQFTREGIKLINVRNLVDNKLITSNTETHISEDEANNKYKHFLVDEGDLIIASSGISVDTFYKKIAFARKDNLPLCMNTSTIRFKTLDEKILDINFFRYFLMTKYFADQVRKYITGSAQLNFGPSHLKIMNIPLPPLETQKHIVSILERAEKLKEKRQITNEDTNKIIQSVFYEMFGDPVKNEKGWDKKLISEIGEVLSGSTPKTNVKEYWGGNINWVTPAELSDGDNYIYSETQRKITQKGLKSIGNRLFPKNTVILTTRAPIGKVAIAGTEMCSNQGFKNIICKDKLINYIYLYVYLLGQKNYLNSIGTGATFKEISKKTVENISIMVPPIELQNQFAEIVQRIESLKEKQKQSNNDINILFDVLMQKAFKGELVE